MPLLPSSIEELLEADPLASDPANRFLVRGAVLRSKVLGRKLAFCTLKPEAHAELGGQWQLGPPTRDRLGRRRVVADEASEDGEAVRPPAPESSAVGLCFSAGLMATSGALSAQEDNAWEMSSGSASATSWAAFPERRSELPVGMRLEASVLLAPAYREEPLVLRWRALQAASDDTPLSSAGPPSLYRDLAAHHAARNAANQAAREELLAAGRGPSLCKFWAAERWLPGGGRCCGDGCRFRHHFAGEEERERAEAAEAAKLRSQELSAQERSVYDEVQDGPHGDSKAAKSLRASRFAAWLLEQYGREGLRAGSGVLDVAGGQGDLSWALSFDEDVPSTLIDPGLRRGGELKSWQRRALRKSGKKGFEHLPEEFCERLFGAPPVAGGVAAAGDEAAPYAPLLLQASLVVGLHPDEATEAIVDLALASGRRFAVVPCCVFANKFPDRRLPDTGEQVRTLNQFCAYLRGKDERIREALLDFEGRNKVLYIP